MAGGGNAKSFVYSITTAPFHLLRTTRERSHQPSWLLRLFASDRGCYFRVSRLQSQEKLKITYSLKVLLVQRN